MSQDGLSVMGGPAVPLIPERCRAQPLSPWAAFVGVVEAGASVTSLGSSAVHCPGKLQQRMLAG